MDELKTSYRVVGEDKVDEFAALCCALRLRPHQLVSLLVAEGIARYRQDPATEELVRLVCDGRRQHRRHQEVNRLNQLFESS